MNSSIVGIGIDLVKVDRIRDLSLRWQERFKRKIFTDAEIKKCESRITPYECFAARFAAKEATFKAIGTGLRNGASWHDVEIVSDQWGKPELILRGKTREFADRLGASRYFVSLSHTKTDAIANVIICR